MNNSYSGDFFQSPLSGKIISASTPKKTQKKLPRNIDIFGYLEDPSLTLLREDMLRAKSFDSVSTQDLERLYWHLRDYSYYCGRVSNYDEALETEKLLEYVFLELKDRKSQSKPQIYSEILNPTFFQNQQMKWMQQLINFDEETAKKVESIKDRHNSEIKLLESRWKQNRLRPYNKLSPSLRDLANNEQTASTAGDFVTARSLHDDIVHKKKEELKEAQYKADNEYNSILNSLKQRQESELENFVDTRFHKRELLIRKQQNEMETIEDKANISLYRMNNAKPFKSSENSLPFRGLIRPFINTNQLNAISLSPNLLPPIRPPPLKNENWSSQKVADSKKVIKCVPKTRHKIDFQTNEFDLVNAMQILKKRFLKMTQENNDENKKNSKSKKKMSDDDLFDYNAYYENQRNPAHLKLHVKKKKEETNELVQKQQPYFEPVKRKMNVESIMKKVKEKEANKRKPPVIHSKRKPLKPPKRTKFMNEEEEEEYEDNFNENESNMQFKQKVDIITSKNDAYNRIIDGKNMKNSNEKTEKMDEIKNEKKKGDESELKSIEIIKKGKQKQVDKFFNFKEKEKDELKLFFCEQDRNSINELNSYNSYSYSSNEISIITNNSEKLKNSSSTRKMHKKIDNKKLSNGGQSDYSYYYSEYSFDGHENVYRDRDGNEIFIFKNNDIKDKSHQKKKSKKQYTKVIKIDYDYTNIKNEYEEEVEEEIEEKVNLKNKQNAEKYDSKSRTKSKGNHSPSKKTKKEKEKNNEKEIQKGHKSTKQDNSKNESNSSKVNHHHHSKKDKKSVKESHTNSDLITSSSNISHSPTNLYNKNNHCKQSDENQNEEESSISYTQNESQIEKSKLKTQILSNEESKYRKDNAKDNSLHSQDTKTESSGGSNNIYNSHHHKSDKKNHDNENLSNDESQSHKTIDNDENQSYKSIDNDESQSHKSLNDDESQSYKTSSNDETKLDSIESDKKGVNLNSRISKKRLHKDKNDKNKNDKNKNDKNKNDKNKNDKDRNDKNKNDKNKNNKNSQAFSKQDSSSNDVLKKDKSSSSLSASHSKKHNSSSSNSYSESSNRITSDNDNNNNRNFSYSKVSHINIETEKEKNKIGEGANKSPYIPKLVLSSTVPLESVKKTKKLNLSKKHFNQKELFVTPKPNKTKFEIEIEKGDECSLREDKVCSSQRKNHKGKNIAKLASSSKITSKILSNAVNPLNDGSLFGAGIETKSTGVVKIKH